MMKPKSTQLRIVSKSKGCLSIGRDIQILDGDGNDLMQTLNIERITITVLPTSIVKATIDIIGVSVDLDGVTT